MFLRIKRNLITKQKMERHMADMNNINNIGGSLHTNFQPQIKKEEPQKPELPQEEPKVKSDATGLEHAEVIGRSVVEMKRPNFASKVDEDLEIFMKNPEFVAMAMDKSFDTNHELLLNDGAKHPYEQACVEICKAVEDRLQ